ncbi:DUF6276 family protein [Haladaptatus caseinilyticus]|uniref:DUF6276 family protein n=1 Tax=Haladaptatus caseinilyticus TaxID=2993314 RepID=UPI00224A5176|nr:DUF6276 family protein [Haladaptatus caseinilyticus]
MTCPECGDERLPFTVPSELREYVPSEPASVLLCPHCLHLDPTEDVEAELADFTRISSTLPEDRDVAAAMILATALLSSLALHRQRIDALLDRVEAAGIDPLLALDRLAADSELEPNFDIESRRQQLLQLRD